MAVAPEEIIPALNLTDRETLSQLNTEGRTPIVLFPTIEVYHHEATHEAADASPQALIPGRGDIKTQKLTITPEEARQIAQIQQELLRH